MSHSFRHIQKLFIKKEILGRHRRGVRSGSTGTVEEPETLFDVNSIEKDSVPPSKFSEQCLLMI